MRHPSIYDISVGVEIEEAEFAFAAYGLGEIVGGLLAHCVEIVAYEPRIIFPLLEAGRHVADEREFDAGFRRLLDSEGNSSGSMGQVTIPDGFFAKIV